MASKVHTLDSGDCRIIEGLPVYIVRIMSAPQKMVILERICWIIEVSDYIDLLNITICKSTNPCTQSIAHIDGV